MGNLTPVLLSQSRQYATLSDMSTMSSAEGGRIPEFTLGWRMRLALETAGISVAAIAVKLGYSRSSISRWLNDADVPRAVVLDAWVRETGVDRRWLETGEGSSPIGPNGLPAGEPETALAKLASKKRAHRGAARSSARYAA